MRKALRDLLETHCVGESIENCNCDIDTFSEKVRWCVVREFYNYAAENPRLSSADRIFTGKVCSNWLKTKSITVDDYLRSLSEFLCPVEDLAIDIPKIWVYVSEFIGERILFLSVIIIT